MLVKRVGLLIGEFNPQESREGAFYHIEELGRSPLSLKELISEGESVSSFAFTDDRETADILKRYGIGFAVYDNKKSKAASFADALYVIDLVSSLDAERIDRMLYRYLRLPWKIAETKRCVIRETTEEDLDALYEIYSEPSITRYTEGLYEDRKEELDYTRAYIDEMYRFYEFGIWSVLDRESRKLIGRAGFSTRKSFPEPELGYVIAVPYQRQGIATEVCRKLLSYAVEYLNFTSINAFTRADNTASVSLLKRLGFVYIEEIFVDGKPLQRYNISCEQITN